MKRFNWKLFGKDVRHARGDHGLRETARTLGIHHATFCRGEHGKPISAPHLVYLCDWMGRSPSRYLRFTPVK